MNKEERVVAALSREEPDRVPLYDLIDNLAVIERYGGERLTLENASEVLPLAVSRMLDMTRVWLPHAPGRRVDEQGWTHERGEWFNEWRVGAPFDDLPSLIAYVRREIERLEAWEPSDPAARLAQLLSWKERYRGTVIPANTVSEALSETYIPIGLEWWVELEATAPELVARWLEVAHQKSLRRLQAEIGNRAVSPVAWIFDDIAYHGRLMFSPTYLRQHGVFQHMAEICDLYHSQGLKVIFHSDGYIRPIVPDLIAAGVDALAPIEVEAGLDLAELKANFGHQVGFVGGVNVAEVLRYGSADDVRRAVLRALAAAGPGGGLVLGSSSEELFDALPPENVVAMVETTKECGRYPIGKHFPTGFDWR